MSNKKLGHTQHIPCIKPRAIRTTWLAALLIGASFSSQAADTIKLKFADWLPLSHYTLDEGVKPWMEATKQASNGSIDFEYYPAQQIGKAKDMATLAQAGVADIVHISPAYISEKFPLSGVAELPDLFSNTCDGNRGLMTLMRPGGFLDEKEYKPLGLRVLWAMTYAPYAIVTTNKKVTALDELKGLKMRTAGGAMDITASQVGSVPIKMTGPDVLPSLQRGTLDGMFVTLLSLKPFDWQTALKYMTTNVNTASFVSVFAITEKAWNKLSPEQQKVLAKTSEESAMRICAWIDMTNKNIIADLQKEGMQEVLMTDVENTKLSERLAETRKRWAASLDGMGKPGTETLERYQKAM
ncbi:TRAP transporter substrate-binding protein DctP [Pollutimonas bauzanensis]|uniref:TRAP transporter substrate-binding protein n=1 Tax=Pollutimonas bauzanensis TaxID=658167 RepID=UPI00333EC4FD